MKYAVISDVHGNAPALRLVLEDAHQQGAQGYLLAGDYCISAPWPNECVSLLRALPNCRAIRGNNDAMYVFPHDDSGQYEVARWCRAVLQSDHRSWLDALPPDLSFTCEGVHVRMAHSSEAFVGKTMHASFRSGMLPLRYPHAPVSRERLLADFRSLPSQDGHFRECVYALDPGVYIFGHNHIQCHADFDGRLLINPGSCGDPLDCGDPGVPYTLLTIENGRCTVEERRVPWDAEATIAQVIKSDQYRCARVWSEIMFAAWRTRREKAGSFLRFCEAYARRMNDPRRPFASDTWEAAFAAWQQTAPLEHPELFIS